MAQPIRDIIQGEIDQLVSAQALAELASEGKPAPNAAERSARVAAIRGRGVAEYHREGLTIEALLDAIDDLTTRVEALEGN